MDNDLEQDDEIIELTQVVDEESLHGLDQGRSEPDALEDEIIELTDIHTSADEIRAEEIQDNDLAEEIQDNDLAGESGLMVDPSVSREQLDAALERVIEKKFTGKIEKILFEVMEKVIEKEVVDLKARLQKDLDKIGNA